MTLRRGRIAAAMDVLEREKIVFARIAYRSKMGDLIERALKSQIRRCILMTAYGRRTRRGMKRGA